MKLDTLDLLIVSEVLKHFSNPTTLRQATRAKKLFYSLSVPLSEQRVEIKKLTFFQQFAMDLNNSSKIFKIFKTFAKNIAKFL